MKETLGSELEETLESELKYDSLQPPISNIDIVTEESIGALESEIKSN